MLLERSFSSLKMLLKYQHKNIYTSFMERLVDVYLTLFKCYYFFRRFIEHLKVMFP